MNVQRTYTGQIVYRTGFEVKCFIGHLLKLISLLSDWGLFFVIKCLIKMFI